MRGFFRSVLDVAYRFIPTVGLAIFEQLGKRGQGKGWGSSTVRKEVDSALALAQRFAIKNLTIFDIGANNGLWSMAMLKMDDKCMVYAFEPSHVAFTKLQMNLGEFDRVSLFQSGFSDQAGTFKLYSDALGSGFASLTKRRLDHFDLPFEETEEVQIYTVDDFLASHPSTPSPDILKLDVEGLELQILHGARKTLKSVNVVQFEFGGANIDSRTYFQDFWYFFEPLGFEIFRLGPKGLSSIKQYSESDEIFETTNYFAVRKQN